MTWKICEHNKKNLNSILQEAKMPTLLRYLLFRETCEGQRFAKQKQKTNRVARTRNQAFHETHFNAVLIRTSSSSNDRKCYLSKSLYVCRYIHVYRKALNSYLLISFSQPILLVIRLYDDLQGIDRYRYI